MSYLVENLYSFQNSLSRAIFQLKSILCILHVFHLVTYAYYIPRYVSSFLTSCLPIAVRLVPNPHSSLDGFSHAQNNKRRRHLAILGSVTPRPRENACSKLPAAGRKYYLLFSPQPLNSLQATLSLSLLHQSLPTVAPVATKQMALLIPPPF